MSDCIEREKAINALDALCDRVCQYSKKQRSAMCSACALGAAFDVIEELPAADSIVEMRPVVHGTWELTTLDDGYGEYQLYKCDKCGVLTAQRRNFCPKCGADMRTEEGE